MRPVSGRYAGTDRMGCRTAAVATALVSLGLAASANASPALSFTASKNSVLNSQQDFTVGWAFRTTTSSVIVVALGAFSLGQAGQEVRLYQGDGTVLASALVMSSDAQEGSPPFYSHSITPVTLAADTTYYIAQDLPQGVNAWLSVDSPVSTDPAITYLSSVGGQGMGGKPLVDELFDGNLDPAYFGPNLDIVLPEPAGMLAFGAGFIGLTVVRRRRPADRSLRR